MVFPPLLPEKGDVDTRSFHRHVRDTGFPVFTRIQQKQSKQQFYEKFEAALKVERTVLVLT